MIMMILTILTFALLTSISVLAIIWAKVPNLCSSMATNWIPIKRKKKIKNTNPMGSSSK